MGSLRLLTCGLVSDEERVLGILRRRADVDTILGDDSFTAASKKMKSLHNAPTIRSDGGGADIGNAGSISMHSRHGQ